MYNISRNISKACIYIVVSVLPAMAAEERYTEDSKGIFNIILENDLFAGDDRDYTNGIRFSWLSSEEKISPWIRSIANLLPMAGNGKKRVSIAAGQNMFTPRDITVSNPSASEHPYAGWSYGSIGIISDTDKILDNAMLTVGMVGPSSHAEQSQSFIHHLVGSPHAQGWDNQLKDEVGVILTYERNWRGMYEFSPFGIGGDITPRAGINLGNINTDAQVGATLRIGFDLPTDYGPPRIRPSLPGSDFFIPTKVLGGYLFTTVAERVVARNIFLDGNNFRDSARVDKEILVGSLEVGAAITYKQARLSYTQVFMQREYHTQQDGQSFGVLTLSYRF